jgi:putative intracellular protease/amidase
MRLSIVVFDGFTALDVVGGYEVLANVPGIEVELVAPERGVVATDTRRLGLLAHRRLEEVTQCDILYVPGGPGVVGRLTDGPFLERLAILNASATWTLGVCNGVALLAAAGILTPGMHATTNWGWRERVAGYGVRVVAERYNRDGSVVTAAGVSASIDGALFLTGLIAGEEMARLIQLGIEYFPSPPPFLDHSVEDVPEPMKDLVLAFESGTAAARLAEPAAFASVDTPCWARGTAFVPALSQAGEAR